MWSLRRDRRAAPQQTRCANPDHGGDCRCPQGERSSVAPEHDPLFPVAAQFSLGRPFGMLPLCGSGAETMQPFGLRRARTTESVEVIDFARCGYDHERQIGLLFDGGRWSPLLRHTDGQTSTTTRPDGQGGPDSDVDYRED
jgi:putative ATP-grasp target RiPP